MLTDLIDAKLLTAGQKKIPVFWLYRQETGL